MWRVLVALAVLVSAGPALSADRSDNADLAKVRIEMAAGQRYRSQKIAKSACFAMSGYRSTFNAAEALTQSREFGKTLTILLEGSVESGLAVERFPAIRERIARAEQTWATLNAATQQIVAGDFHSVPVMQIIDFSEKLLVDAQAIVELIERFYGAQHASVAGMLKTINLAGRQRMLSQRTARAYCFAALNVDRTRLLAAMAEDQALFEASMVALRDGDPAQGIVAPTRTTIYFYIHAVQMIWEAYQEPLSRLGGQEGPMPDDAAIVEQTSEQLLQALDRLVKSYLPLTGD